MSSVYCVFLIDQTENRYDEIFRGVFASLESATYYCNGFNKELSKIGQRYLPIICNTRDNAANLFKEGEILVIEEMVPVVYN